MKENNKKNEQLLTESEQLRQSIAEPERSNSELKRVEEELWKSEEKLRNIIENINDVVFQLSPLGIIEYVSPRVQELYGYKPEELIGKHLKKTTPKSEVPKALKVLKIALSGKTVKNIEIDQLDWNGKIVHMEINSTPVKKNGKVIAVQGVMRDITERKRAMEMLQKTHQELERRVEERTAELSKTNVLLRQEINERKRTEEALRESEEELEAIFNDVRDGIVLLDMTGKIIKINKRITETTGYADKDIVGKRFKLLKMFTADSIIRMITAFAKTVAGQQSPPYEVEGYIKTGEKRIAEIHSSQLNKRGKTVGAVAVIRDITERKLVEKELKNSEERFRSLTENAPIGIYYNELNGTFLYGNKKAEEIVGYKREELIGKSFLKLKLISPKDVVRAAKLLLLNKQGKSTGPDEFVLTRKDGTKKIVEINTSVITLSGKKLVIGMVQDITDRKQMEQALRESEEELEAIFNDARIGIARFDKTGKILRVNQRILEIGGYAEQEIVGKRINLLKMFPPKSMAMMLANFTKLIAGKKVLPFDVEVYTKKGEKLTIELHGSLLRKKGKVAGMVGIMRDITDRKRMEVALRESEERFRRVVETMEVGLGAIDEHGVLTYVNENLAKMLGYSVDEMIGRPTLDFYYDEESRKAQEEIFAKRRAGMRDTTPYEVTWRRKDEQKVYAILSPTPSFDANGRYTGSFAIHTDITERKLMEEALRQSEANLKKAQEVGYIGSWHLDLKKNELIWSDETCRIFGVPQETVLTYEEFLEAVHPDDREYVDSAWTAALNKELYDIEHRIVVNGEVKWVRERAEVELDDTVKGIRATGTVQDITDLKRAEEKLRESEGRYRSLVESSTDAIVMLDHDENVITCNQAFLDLFGYQKEEIIGKAIRIIHPSDESAQKFRDAHYQTLERTGSVRTEWEYVRKDGTSFPAELVISLISSAEGTIIGCISIIRDITERKRADEKLKTNFDTLSKSLESTVSALASAFEVRDPYTAGHQQRVTDLACAIAEDMGLGVEQIAGIRMAGLIHDIGKINIPAEILNKPGHLTEIEYSLFKNHPQIGHDVLKTVEFPWPVAQIVLQHHERIDGSGYPQGLKGEEILLEARILAVADIVEAIASHRPYRPARGIGDALEEILHNKGTLYDPAVVDACLKVFYERGFKFEQTLKVATSAKIH